MTRSRNSFLLLFAVVFLATGCAVTKDYSSIESLSTTKERAKISLMRPDVELAILTAGGVPEPQAEWTEAAHTHLKTAINAYVLENNIDLVHYQTPDESEPLFDVLTELEHLHGAVGKAILQHKYTVPLPSKKDTFDWSLGSDISALQEKTDADYALFIHIRDSYSSAGRVFMQFAAAAFGVGLQGGQQIGFASLVDLQTGDIVWFNHLQSSGGDLRTEAPAAKTVGHLLNGLPQ